VTVGGIISMGILRMPGQVAEQLPDPWWYMAVWIAAGLFALLGTTAAAELATALPRAGGYYVYAHRAFGPFVGFVSGWTDWLVWCGSITATTFVIMEYLHLLIQDLPDQDVLVAIAMTVAFAMLQWRGVRWGSNIHNVTSIIKTLIFLFLIGACFFVDIGPTAVSDAPAISSGYSIFGAFVISLQGVIYAYDGWVFSAYFSEEVKDPGKNIPKAMFGGILFVIGVYLIINLALLRMLPMEQIAGSELAIGIVVQNLFGPSTQTILTAVFTGFMIIGLNLGFMIASRVVYAMSVDGLFMKKGTTVNEGGTPTNALLATVVAAVIFLVTGTFEDVLAILSFFAVVNYAFLFSALFTLRRNEPDLPRPYRAWGYPWTTGLTLIGSVVFLAGLVMNDTTNSLYAVGLVALSYPVYRILQRT
jgi:basic amino acid/polyamine antiporter, APA family